MSTPTDYERLGGSGWRDRSWLLELSAEVFSSVKGAPVSAVVPEGDRAQA